MQNILVIHKLQMCMIKDFNVIIQSGFTEKILLLVLICLGDILVLIMLQVGPASRSVLQWTCMINEKLSKLLFPKYTVMFTAS